MSRLLSAMRTQERPTCALQVILGNWIHMAWSWACDIHRLHVTAISFELLALPNTRVLSRTFCCIICASLFLPSSRQPPRFVLLSLCILEHVLGSNTARGLLAPLLALMSGSMAKNGKGGASLSRYLFWDEVHCVEADPVLNEVRTVSSFVMEQPVCC